MIQIYIHLAGLDNVVMEIDELPNPSDNFVLGRNPRRRDGKPIPFILEEVNTVIFPTSVITFIEIMPTGEEEEIETFIRE